MSFTSKCQMSRVWARRPVAYLPGQYCTSRSINPFACTLYLSGNEIHMQRLTFLFHFHSHVQLLSTPLTPATDFLVPCHPFSRGPNRRGALSISHVWRVIATSTATTSFRDRFHVHNLQKAATFAKSHQHPLSRLTAHVCILPSVSLRIRCFRIFGIGIGLSQTF
jgi:hypothetical protein